MLSINSRFYTVIHTIKINPFHCFDSIKSQNSRTANIRDTKKKNKTIIVRKQQGYYIYVYPKKSRVECKDSYLQITNNETNKAKASKT